jgi:hypothetical protein
MGSLTNSVSRTGRDNNEIALPGFSVGCRPHAGSFIRHEGDVGEIAHLGVTHRSVVVDEEQLEFAGAGNGGGSEDQGVGCGAADLAHAYDGDAASRRHDWCFDDLRSSVL